MKDRCRESGVRWGREQYIAFVALVVPTVAVAIGILQIASGEATLFDGVLFLLFFVLTMYGVEAGFHRYMSHAAFKANKFIKAIHIILGSAAIQGPVLFWVAIHRQHHAHEDTIKDPHSPRTEEPGFASQIHAHFHGHVGWLFSRTRPDWGRYVSDLLKDKVVLSMNQMYPIFVLGGLLLPMLIGYVYYQTFLGAVQGLLWGGLIRVFCVHHCVWAVNSICHLLGTRPYKTKGMSTNNAAFALFTMGGSWHNNHHAFKYTAYNSFRWYQLDMCGLIIKTLNYLNLVHSVQFPDKELRTLKLKVNQAAVNEEPVPI